MRGLGLSTMLTVPRCFVNHGQQRWFKLYCILWNRLDPYSDSTRTKSVLIEDSMSVSFQAQHIPVFPRPHSHITASSPLKKELGTSLVVQWLRLNIPNAGGPGFIPHQETLSYMLQLKFKCYN